MSVVAFTVNGTPAPKGSFRISVRRGKPVVRKDSDKTETWHTAVGWAAKVATQGRTPFKARALRASITFWLARPKGHFRKDGSLKESAPRYPAVKPDIDKLVRATLDPMEGLVFDGDSRVVHLTAAKHYTSVGVNPGAWIEVEEAL